MTHADMIRLELPAKLTYLSLASACLAEILKPIGDLADAESTVYSVQLAVQEACVNIVQHAYRGAADGRIGLQFILEASPRRLVVNLNDTGQAFDWASIGDPDLNEVHEHGYGLFLMRSLMDEVAYTTQPDGNHWRLVKSL